MSQRRIAFAVTIGLIVGGVGLAAQQPPRQRSITENSMRGHDMAQMMSMCQQMADMMGGQGMMSGQGLMGGQGMMGGQDMMGPSPAGLIRQKDALELTDAQVERLTELDRTIAAQRERHMTEVGRLDEQIRTVLNEETPDLDRLETLLEARAAEQVRMQVARARAGQEARALLTEEQRSNLGYGMRLMRGMMGQMMDRMPTGGTAVDGGAHRHDGPGSPQ